LSGAEGICSRPKSRRDEQAEVEMRKFGFTKLIVDDLEGQAAFYAALYEFQILHRIRAQIGDQDVDEIILGAGEEGEPLLVIFKYLDGRKASAGEVILGLMTMHFDKTIKGALENGGAISVPPFVTEVTNGRVAFITDPEGHLIEIVEIS
jgi:predicted enzyme related to lactoylglutathione lyase